MMGELREDSLEELCRSLCVGDLGWPGGHSKGGDGSREVGEFNMADPRRG